MLFTGRSAPSRPGWVLSPSPDYHLTVPTRSRIVTKSVARSAERHARGGVLVGGSKAIVQGRLSRSRLVRNGAALALGVCLLIAVGGPASSALAAAKGAQAARATAASSGTFVVADTSSVQKLDPDVVTNFLDFQALGLIYDQLVQYNRQLKIVPDLATSWAYSNGNRLLTFQLRKGVKFDDGTTFTSADVVASLQRALPREDRRRLGLVPREREEDRCRRALRREVRAERAGQLDPRRPHLGEPVHALDQGDRRRHAGQDARRHRAVRLLELEPRQHLCDQGEPELLGWEGDASVR